MRKTDKKIENQLRMVLTEVCETSLKQFVGFQWLTHLVDYAHFPNSLKVVSVFDSNENLSEFLAKGYEQELRFLIEESLTGIGVNTKAVAHLLAYDTEENGAKDGNLTIKH